MVVAFSGVTLATPAAFAVASLANATSSGLGANISTNALGTSLGSASASSLSGASSAASLSFGVGVYATPSCGMMCASEAPLDAVVVCDDDDDDVVCAAPPPPPKFVSWSPSSSGGAHSQNVSFCCCLTSSADSSMISVSPASFLCSHTRTACSDAASAASARAIAPTGVCVRANISRKGSELAPGASEPSSAVLLVVLGLTSSDSDARGKADGSEGGSRGATEDDADAADADAADDDDLY